MPSLGGWEWVILVFVVFPVLFISALVSIARSKAASGTEKGIWILISLVVPVIGPILWFAVGKRASQGATSPTS